jgi:ATP-dependent RNA helicase RhlE
VLVFVDTKFACSRLAHFLERHGISADSIHGDKSQQARTETLENFKSGKVRVLVATDVAARGLDIEDLPSVINFELPHTAEDYVHRIGRTGRAGKSGKAVSLVSSEERHRLADIQKLIKLEIKQEIVPGYDPEPDFFDADGSRRRRSAPASRPTDRATAAAPLANAASAVSAPSAANGRNAPSAPSAAVSPLILRQMVLTSASPTSRRATSPRPAAKAMAATPRFPRRPAPDRLPAGRARSQALNTQAQFSVLTNSDRLLSALHNKEERSMKGNLFRRDCHC